MPRRSKAMPLVRLLTAEGVREARAQSGLVQREYAALLGVDLSALQRWEGGQRRVHPSAARLMLALQRDPALQQVLLAPA